MKRSFSGSIVQDTDEALKASVAITIPSLQLWGSKHVSTFAPAKFYPVNFSRRSKV